MPKSVRRPLRDFEFVCLLGAMSMIGPFAIDSLFPAFPVAGAALGVSQAQMQQTISHYMFAFAAGSLLHGPLSDSFGRRPIVLLCVLGFVLASLACWLAPSFSWLLAGRAVQGFCAAGGTVISRALVRDRFDGARAQQATTQITLVFLLGPAIAPVIGGLILKFAGVNEWRYIFAFMTLYSVLVALALWHRLAESHPQERRLVFSPAALGFSFCTILQSRPAVWLILAAAFNFSGLFLMISSAPAIVFGLWKLGTLDLWKLFCFAMGGIFLGSQVSGFVAARWTHARTIGLGFLLMGCGCISHLAYGAIVSQASWPLAALPLLLYAAGSSMAYPSLTVLLMDRFPERRGAAASLQTFTSLAFNGVVAGTISPLVALSTLGLAVTQTLAMLCGLLSYGLFIHAQKRLQRTAAAAMESL
jgi:MFS transporter, DHA1 family, multidrug resistance protein